MPRVVDDRLIRAVIALGRMTEIDIPKPMGMTLEHYIAALIANDDKNVTTLVNMIKTVWRCYLNVEKGPDSAMHDPAMELIHHVAHNRPEGVNVDVEVTTGRRKSQGMWRLSVRKLSSKVVKDNDVSV